MAQPVFFSAEDASGLSPERVRALLEEALAPRLAELRAVLIVGPDYTRRNSFAGLVCGLCHSILKDWCTVDFLEATGTHDPMTLENRRDMYPDIPDAHFFSHHWRQDCVPVGTISAETVSRLSQRLYEKPIEVELNYRLLDRKYDLILSVGQVVPHAVAGMANYSKNLLIGTGGKDMIQATHLIGAYYGMERIMGLDHTPARELMDYALHHFLSDLPLLFIQTVTHAPDADENLLCGLYISNDRRAYEHALALSQQCNITWLAQPLQTALVYLDPAEFHSTWTANKGIHRLKTAMRTGGTLVVVTPGVHCFSEDPAMDRLIARYGYCGRDRVKTTPELQREPAVAAHLIHGSTEGRFTIYYYAPLLGREKIESAGYRSLSEHDLHTIFRFPNLTPGYQNIHDPNSLYYVPQPALGLWRCRES